MTSIDVNGLTKEFGGRRVLDRLTFTVRPGRVTGFLGPNGAGKSTTLRVLLGLDRATAGTAVIGGRPYPAIPDPLREVGALLDPQAPAGARTARDHLRVLAAAARIPRARIGEVLEQTGIAAAADRRIRTYSLGMRQRLGIAAALLGDPAVLVLDEPSNGLDPEGIVWIRRLLGELAGQGRTVLVSSHLMAETASCADHVVVLARGRLLADTAMRDFVDAWTTPRVHVRTARPEPLRRLLADRGLVPVATADGRWRIDGARVDDIGPAAAEAGVPLLELAGEEPSLEEAYLALTEGESEFAGAPRIATRAREAS
ncbi:MULTISPECIES: ATP-binding cassette domain-containing protein [unclassified Streptomyces]|uniref:ATP-binding cassette domain-containing protein n=1 Tax=unclassified Streptomyces TaxID=2593676 RepID=UPI003408F718